MGRRPSSVVQYGGSAVALSSGIDLVEIDRVERLVERWGGRFLEIVFTPEEIAYCGLRAPQLAARFAAKEAAMKALGTGRRGVGWREIEVITETSGRPTLALHGAALRRAGELGWKSVELSLTHSRTQALALVVVER